MTAPRDAIVGRKGRTDAIEAGLTQLAALFKDRLDKRMKKFATKNATFFTDYTNARQIVDLGGRKEEKPAA